MAEKGKPILVAVGASTMGEVETVMQMVMGVSDQIVLMQCNTNYTASESNYDHLNINVLKTLGTMYPNVILGLSDHTQSPAPVVGAVALGARVIERHFTDSNDREGRRSQVCAKPRKLGQDGF